MLLEQLLWVFWDFLMTAFTDIRTVPLPLVVALSKMVTLAKKFIYSSFHRWTPVIRLQQRGASDTCFGDGFAWNAW